jgi:Dolichyl-phosphate-mannose-protein mannosyltransferase
MTVATDPTALEGREVPDPSSRRDLLRGSPLTRRDALVALGWAVVVMVVAWVWRSPIVPTDPWHYVRSALEFPSDDWVPLGFTRYGIILATIPPAYVFKNAEASYYFWPLASAGLLAAALYLVGRRLWSPIAGVVAVVITITNGVVFLNLSRGYPDIMSIALVMTALVCALMARDRGLTGRAATGWILAAGFLLGWGFEVRETALLAWPIVFAVLWKRGSVLRTYAVLAAPLVAWALLDIGVSGLVYGDPLLKAHTLMGSNPTGVGNVPPPPPVQVDTADRTRIGFFLAIPRAALERPDGLWLVVSGVLAVLAVLIPNRGLRLASFGFISVYGLNLLAGGVLLPSRPFGTLVVPRYWIQYVPFIGLVVGGLVSVVSAWLLARMSSTARWLRLTVVGLVAAAACLTPVWLAVRQVPQEPAFAVNGGDALEDLRTHLDGKGFAVDQVWTDWETKRILPAYQRPFFGGAKAWQGTPTSLTGAGAPGPGDAVLLYSARSSICGHCRNALEPWLAKNPTIPSNWDLVYENGDKTLQLYLVR